MKNDSTPSFEEKVNDEAKDFNDKLHASTPSEGWESELRKRFENYALVRKSDNGLGIPINHKENLFGYFKEIVATAKQSARQECVEKIKIDYHPFSMGCNGCREKTLEELENLINSLEEERSNK